jgi:GT2 family glycosyltransferase
MTSNKITLSASLVIYKNDPEMLNQVLTSFGKIPVKSTLVVIDNSPTPELSNLFIAHENVEYFHMDGDNLGFGKAHNVALSKISASPYHLVLNPDVYFEDGVVPELIAQLETSSDIGLIQPKVLFPDGRIQYLCKRYPTFLTFFVRRFIPKSLHSLIQKRMDWYEMRDTGYDKTMDVPVLSGCFMLFRRTCLDEVGYFDDKMFMYCEDFDLTLRMARKYRTVFYPHVHIFHHWNRGSHKSLKLTWVFIRSAIYFFNKHGWRIA